MRVFRPGRVGAAVALVLLTAVATSGPALAQTAIELGGNATISNGTECAANVRAQVYLSLGEAEPLPLGSVTTDAEGHFEVSVPIPADLSTGAATILIDCGISGSLLTYDVELQNGSSRIFSLDLGTLVVYGAALLAMAFILHMAFTRLRRSRDAAPLGLTSDQPTPAPEAESAVDPDVVSPEENSQSVGETEFAAAFAGPAPSADAEAGAFGVQDGTFADSELVEALPPPFGIDETAPADAPSALDSTGYEAESDEDDDGAEYWFWDIDTNRGPARRLAVLTEHTFHLDEVLVDGFPALLERIAEVGPEAALSNSFLHVQLADIDDVYRRGTEMKIAYRDASGSPVARTIDLGTEIGGVLDLLSRRFVVHEVALPA
jgi:hypothetical protein